MEKLKAYIVADRRYWDGSTVVFAETAGKAKALARFTDACEDIDFVDVSARRAPALDKAYRGVWEMDWWNDQDRIAMVRDANFQCDLSELSAEDLYCSVCPAKEWCQLYADLEEEKRNDFYH